MYGLIEGRIVHYVLNEGPKQGEHRPAIVVKVWRTADGKTPENGCSQLLVFTDKTNDVLNAVLYKTSVTFDESCTPGTWHPFEPEIEKEYSSNTSNEEIASPPVQEDPASTGSQ